ncbi:MAG TPA: DUF3301 domain-containing protein [Rhodocyclaceae bacterium]|nr:DUF3301 domain-containing protein [Rhodocyclaceae bacterium]
MDIFEVSFLALLGLAAWLWFDSLRAREAAIASVKRACKLECLQLLDDTVAIKRIGLKRNSAGVVCMFRIYSFEYTETGNERTVGTAQLLGHRVTAIELNLRYDDATVTLH